MIRPLKLLCTPLTEGDAERITSGTHAPDFRPCRAMVWHRGLAVFGVIVGMTLAGCNRVPTFFEPPAPATPSKSTPAVKSPVTAPAPDQGRQAVTTVKRYVTALRDRDYDTAYELLAKDARDTHTRAAFAQHAKQGMPLYDLDTATATIDGTTAVVTVRMAEDPATCGFHLTREGEAWKVVYRGGTPGTPSAE